MRKKAFWGLILKGLLITQLHGYEKNNLNPVADRLFIEGHYQDALLHYEEMIQKNEEKESAYLRLAACYLEMGQPDKALTLLNTQKTFPAVEAESERLYLISLSYRHLKDYESAVNVLQLDSSPIRPLVWKSLLSLEKAIALYHLNRPIEAQTDFQSISLEKDAPQAFYMGQLYLARIKLDQKDSHGARDILHQLSSKLPQESPLVYEKEYLMGMSFYLEHHFDRAVPHFEKALPKGDLTKASWSQATLQHLIKSEMELAKSSQNLPRQLDEAIKKAHASMTELLSIEKSEENYLLLGDLFFLQAHLLQDKEAYAKAVTLLSCQGVITTKEGRQKALLKQAAAAPSYSERALIYNQLAESHHSLSEYQMGLNDYHEALLNNDPSLFKKAAAALNRAFFALLVEQKEEASSALKYLFLSYYQLKNETDLKKTLSTLEPLLKNNPNVSKELYTVIAEAGLTTSNEALIQTSVQTTKQALSIYPDDTKLKKMLGRLNFHQKKWEEADSIFAEWPDDSEALYWRSEIAGATADEAKRKGYLYEIFTHDPKGPFSPGAYFHYYTQREYMRGDKNVVKHLQKMPSLYGQHPLTISAYYLMGLDHKKNHLSEEGKVIRRQDLIAAIDAFQLAEATFDQLLLQDVIDKKDLNYFTHVRYQAMLERALANLNIAEDSEGGKKQIYLQYSEGVFKDLINSFDKPTAEVSTYLVQNHPYPKILEEAEYALSKNYRIKNKWIDAEARLDQMLDRYKDASITQSYLLSRAWYDKGMIAKKNNNESAALQNFLLAEQTSGHFLSPDEKLDVWIQQSLCYKALNQYNDAMRLLSKVVNDETISNLRVKAMYLRAELYALEGRKELALKQLEATSKKGGEWGKKAKELYNSKCYNSTAPKPWD